MGQARSVKDPTVVGRRGEVGDSEAPAKQSAFVFESQRKEGKHTPKCDKAAPTTGLSEYFDHNLCGTFNGAEVMS